MRAEKLLCSHRATIREVMVCIEKNGKGTAFIVDDEGRLSGIVTDGDIRRLLLEGYGLNEPIQDYMKKDFVYASTREKAEEIQKKFNYAVRIVPIVDENGKPVDYGEYNENIHISLAQPQLSGNEYKYLMDAFLSTWISSTGKYLSRFEEGFSAWCGTGYGVATSNGTTALHLALAALGIGTGDEVIVPDLTFAATINAVLYTGAKPVIVDLEEESWCMDPEAAERAVTERTKAVIPVHIYGQPCDMGRLCEMAKRHGLYLIEDCAEAHGAEWNGKKTGTYGIISCFSFFGNKVVTTGEGGMCVTNDKGLYERMRILRDHGMSKERKYYHEVVGFNYRMTNLQAAIGTAQVERIDEILKWRTEVEKMYRQAFQGIKGVILQRDDLKGRKKIAWLVSILVAEDRRDAVLKHLKETGVDARAFFIPLSEMELYSGYAEVCRVSRKISHMGINLPTTWEMDREKIQRIAELVTEAL